MPTSPIGRIVDLPAPSMHPFSFGQVCIHSICTRVYYRYHHKLCTEHPLVLDFIHTRVVRVVQHRVPHNRVTIPESLFHELRAIEGKGTIDLGS